MKIRHFISVFFLGAFAFGMTPAAEAKQKDRSLCLSACVDIPASIDSFQKTHALDTESDEIDFLLYRIRNSKAEFSRNGSTYNGEDTAKFLRWKMGWYYKKYHDKIESDQEFVEKILKGSEKSGKSYEMILSDGSRHNAQDIMQNELNLLSQRSHSTHTKTH